GYNNDQPDAEKAYAGFATRQREIANAGPDDPVAPGRLVVEVYWPGDAAWGIASALFYMGSIGHAVETAGQLADLLVRTAQEQTGLLQVDVVAHSMGCRLTLELLKALGARNAGTVSVRRVVLMAAAVPVHKLEGGKPDADLRPGYDARLGEAARSLYSFADNVLGTAFPLGQTFAGAGEGFMPRALG